MRKIKNIVVMLSLCVTAAVSVSACSVVDTVTGNTSVETSEVSSASTQTTTSSNVKTVDTNLAAPVFNLDITSSTGMSAGSTYTLDGTATSSDGGTITYQWYVNNISSNGGGTPIEGATEATYTVDTSEVGIKYYYVVASNNHDDSCNMTTSGIAEVEVVQSGEWSTDEYGGTRYLAADGTYPVSRWLLIGTDTYRFDENGYRTVGWFLNGETYIYFDEEGRYQAGTTVPEGYYIDENNNLVQSVTEETTTEEAAVTEEAAATEEAAVTEEAATDAAAATEDTAATDAAAA